MECYQIENFPSSHEDKAKFQYARGYSSWIFEKIEELKQAVNFTVFFKTNNMSLKNVLSLKKIYLHLTFIKIFI